MWNLKIIIQINLFTKQKQTHRLRENELMVAGGKDEGEGIVRELGMDMYILLYLKWIANQDLRDFV